MTNIGPTRGVPIRIGDETKQRFLRFDMVALERLEIVTGARGLVDVQQRLQQASLRVTIAAIWVGLLHSEPDLEREELAKMLDSTKLTEYAEAIGKALALALPKEGKKNEGKDEPAAIAS